MGNMRSAFVTAPDHADAVTLDAAHRLTTILKIILAAAMITAPLYVLAEGVTHLWRVLVVNGGTTVGMWVLLLLVQRGHVRLVSRLAVWGLLGLVSWLAWANGEPIHVNVVNFVAVLVLAHVLLSPRSVVFVGAACALAMTGIAYRQSLVLPSREANGFVETVVQFLPQLILITVLLRMRSRAPVPARPAPDQPSTPRA